MEISKHAINTGSAAASQRKQMVGIFLSNLIISYVQKKGHEHVGLSMLVENLEKYNELGSGAN